MILNSALYSSDSGLCRVGWEKPRETFLEFFPGQILWANTRMCGHLRAMKRPAHRAPTMNTPKTLCGLGARVLHLVFTRPGLCSADMPIFLFLSVKFFLAWVSYSLPIGNMFRQGKRKCGLTVYCACHEAYLPVPWLTFNYLGSWFFGVQRLSFSGWSRIYIMSSMPDNWVKKKKAVSKIIEWVNISSEQRTIYS